MPAPPTEIRIKRKAMDDPVELLHVQNEYNGLRQVKQYVFKRQRTSNVPNQNTLKPSYSSSLPERQVAILSTEAASNINASQPPEDLSTYRQGDVSAAIMKTPTDRSTGYGTNSRPSVTLNTEPRRFHLARKEVHTALGLTPDLASGVKGCPTVFIEQKRIPELQHMVPSTHTPHVSFQTLCNTSDHQLVARDEKEEIPLIDKRSRPPAPLRNTRLSSGKVIPWDADTATLAAQMQAYTMQEIGYTLTGVPTRERANKSKATNETKQVSSFNPEIPTSDYHERHPKEVGILDATKGLGQDEIMKDATNQDGEDYGYVMDTYIRVPAEMFELEKQKSIGVLILGSQPDIDDFYNDDSDTDSDIYDEEEDENAENHPSTDYPDDEDESDNGLEHSPYQSYHDRNASDSEEYDEEHDTLNDEEARPEWVRRPWMINNAYHESEELENDTED